MPSDVRFADLKTLLEAGRYSLVRVRGSHYIFSRQGSPQIVVPVHRGKVKYCYVRQIKKILEGH